MRGRKPFWEKKVWEAVLKRRTSDRIMQRFGRSFIND